MRDNKKRKRNKTIKRGGMRATVAAAFRGDEAKFINYITKTNPNWRTEPLQNIVNSLMEKYDLNRSGNIGNDQEWRKITNDLNLNVTESASLFQKISKHEDTISRKNLSIFIQNLKDPSPQYPPPAQRAPQALQAKPKKNILTHVSDLFRPPSADAADSGVDKPFYDSLTGNEPTSMDSEWEILKEAISTIAATKGGATSSKLMSGGTISATNNMGDEIYQIHKKIGEITIYIEELEKKKEECRDLQATYDREHLELEQYRSNLSEANTTIDTLKYELEKLEKASMDNTAEIERLTGEIANQTDIKNEWANKFREQTTVVTEAKARLDNHLESLKEANKRLTELLEKASSSRGGYKGRGGYQYLKTKSNDARTRKPSTRKPSTRKPSTRKPSTRKPSTRKRKSTRRTGTRRTGTRRTGTGRTGTGRSNWISKIITTRKYAGGKNRRRRTRRAPRRR